MKFKASQEPKLTKEELYRLNQEMHFLKERDKKLDDNAWEAVMESWDKVFFSNVYKVYPDDGILAAAGNVESFSDYDEDVIEKAIGFRGLEIRSERKENGYAVWIDSEIDISLKLTFFDDKDQNIFDIVISELTSFLPSEKINCWAYFHMEVLEEDE